MEIYLGIDYGESRVGVAKSDALGFMAQGIETIKNEGGLKKPAERISEIAKMYSVKTIVVGYPKNMNGTIGPKAEKVDKFIEILSTIMPDVSFVKWDERLTTVAASRTMQEVGVKTKNKKKIVDQIAAVFILQGFLDSKR